MAKRVYNGECLIKCEYCGAVNTAEWKKGLFGSGKWTLRNCTSCNRKPDIRRMETVLCPHCGKLVQKDKSNICPNCSKLIYREEDVFPAECVNCGVVNYIPRTHDKEVFCEVCGERIPADRLRAAVPVHHLEPQNIRLKDQHAMLSEDLVMYRHPLHEFSANSRLQVSEGTWALVLQNGVCQDPWGPGSYMLEESEKDKQAKLNAAANGEDLVQNTDIYCILKTLPGIKWGTGANRVLVQCENDKKETRNYQILANGELIWNVSDPRAFAERVGYRDKIYGKKELTFCSDTSDSELVRDTLAAIHSALTKSARTVIGRENLDPTKLEYHRDKLLEELKIELDLSLDAYGLTCGVLKMDGLAVEEVVDSAVTEAAKRREIILKAARKDYPFAVKDVKLYPGTSTKAYAIFSFDGSVRLNIADEKRFLEAPEITTLPDEPGAAEDYIRSILNNALTAELAKAAQTLISDKKADISQLRLYTGTLADELKRQIPERIAAIGLGVDTLHVDSLSYTESAELKRENETDERKRDLIRYAESTIRWVTPALRVHMAVNDQMSAGEQAKNKGLYADIRFSGDSRLKVDDEERFFRDSRILGFLNSENAADEKTVNSYYADTLQNHFHAKLAGVTQNIINQRGWDIRELPNYTEQLKTLVIETLNNLVSAWGMRTESTFIRIDRMDESEALSRLSASEGDIAAAILEADRDVIKAVTETKKQNELDDIAAELEIHHKENDLKKAEADERIRDAETQRVISGINRDLQVQNAKHESNLRNIGYFSEEKIAASNGQAAVDEAEDKRNAQRTERGYSAEFRKQEHEQQMKRAAEDARHQQAEAEEEQKRILDEIRRRSQLDDARFRKELNGIMHQIDESDLDWRQKLDEYNRLSRQLGVKDAQDARIAAAGTDAEIKRMQGKTDAEIQDMQTAAGFEAGMKGVQLNQAQAELQEAISRYAEERDERKLAADFNRRERMTLLGFQQSLEDRKQKAEETLTALKEQHAEAQREREYLEKLNAMNAEIEKLKLELDAQKTKNHEDTELGIARSADEARTKEAEFRYLEQKEKEQQDRDNNLMDRAEALFRYVQDIGNAMDHARLDLQRHSDDNETAVRRDYADVEKLRALSTNEQQREEILRKLDSLEKEVAGGSGKAGKYTDDGYDKLMKKIQDIIDEIHKNQTTIRELGSKVDELANSRKCWKCGSVLSKKARFCQNCGASLAFGTNQAQKQESIVCPICGVKNKPGEARCTNCGGELFTV